MRIVKVNCPVPARTGCLKSSISSETESDVNVQSSYWILQQFEISNDDFIANLLTSLSAKERALIGEIGPKTKSVVYCFIWLTVMYMNLMGRFPGRLLGLQFIRADSIVTRWNYTTLTVWVSTRIGPTVETASVSDSQRTDDSDIAGLHETIPSADCSRADRVLGTPASLHSSPV